MKKWRFSTNISLYLRNGYSYMGTCSEPICKHRILFPSIQHLAWFTQGRPQGKQKCGKNSGFWTYALTSASYNSAFHLLLCLKFSFKLLLFLRVNYARNQEWLFFSEHSVEDLTKWKIFPKMAAKIAAWLKELKFSKRIEYYNQFIQLLSELSQPEIRIKRICMYFRKSGLYIYI